MTHETASTPDTLVKWRESLRIRREPVEVLTRSQVRSLSEKARDDYDMARIHDINAPMVLPTPQLEALTRRVRIQSYMSLGNQPTARQGLAISGTQRLGKSTAALYLGRVHEQRERDKRNNWSHDIAPVLYVPTPAESTPKQFMTAFTRTLGLPYPSRARTTDSIMDQVVELLSDLQTSLIILDEVQNLRTRASAGMVAANMLKTFTERVSALFLYVGVDLPRSDLLSGPMAEQMQGRVTMCKMEPFSVGSKEARHQWERVIMQFEREFPLADHEVGTLAEGAGWLHDATGGVIGSLRLLLRDAQISAIVDGEERVSLERVRDVPLDFRAQQALNDDVKHGPRGRREEEAA